MIAFIDTEVSLQSKQAKEQRGYHVVSAEVSYILAWRPRDERQEVAVCLANLFMG